MLHSRRHFRSQSRSTWALDKRNQTIVDGLALFFLLAALWLFGNTASAQDSPQAAPPPSSQLESGVIKAQEQLEETTARLKGQISQLRQRVNRHFSAGRKSHTSRLVNEDFAGPSKFDGRTYTDFMDSIDKSEKEIDAETGIIDAKRLVDLNSNEEARLALRGQTSKWLNELRRIEGILRHWEKTKDNEATIIEPRPQPGKGDSPEDLLYRQIVNVRNSRWALKQQMQTAQTASDPKVEAVPSLTTIGETLTLIDPKNSSIVSVAFSPDGKQLATASFDNSVHLWNTTSGEKKFSLSGHSGPVTNVTFSPDGTLLASASHDKTIKLWDATTGRDLNTLKGHSDIVFSVAFSPNGKQLASGSGDKTINVWNVSDGRKAFTLNGHSQSVMKVAFSPDGNLVASASLDNTVKLWGVISGAMRRTFWGHYDSVWSVMFSPDGSTLASAGEDKRLILWNAVNGREVLTIQVQNCVRNLTYSPNGARLATVGNENNVKLWDAKSGQQTYLLKGHRGHVCSVAFSPDGTFLASGSVDGTAKIFSLTPSPVPQLSKGSEDNVTRREVAVAPTVTVEAYIKELKDRIDNGSDVSVNLCRLGYCLAIRKEFDVAQEHFYRAWKLSKDPLCLFHYSQSYRWKAETVESTMPELSVKLKKKGIEFKNSLLQIDRRYYWFVMDLPNDSVDLAVLLLDDAKYKNNATDWLHELADDKDDGETTVRRIATYHIWNPSIYNHNKEEMGFVFETLYGVIAAHCDHAVKSARVKITYVSAEEKDLDRIESDMAIGGNSSQVIRDYTRPRRHMLNHIRFLYEALLDGSLKTRYEKNAADMKKQNKFESRIEAK